MGPCLEETQPRILDAIVESYLEFLGGAYRGVSDGTADLIGKAQKLLDNELKEKRRKYREFQVNAPLLWKTKDGQTAHSLALSDIGAQHSGLMIRKVLLEKRIQSVEEAKKMGGDVLAILLTPGTGLI